MLHSIRGLGVRPFAHHDLWQQRSSVLSEAAVCWEHQLLCQTLGLAVQYDRLDVTNVASLELVTRCLVMMERAVKLNPEAPSFAGREVNTKDLTWGTLRRRRRES